MDNYIIYHKVLELEKNKESALRIPAIFNPSKSEFIIEVNEKAVDLNPAIELCFKDPRLSIANEPISIKMQLNAVLTKINPVSDFGLSSKDLLFISVRSNATFKVTVSVKEIG